MAALHFPHNLQTQLRPYIPSGSSQSPDVASKSRDLGRPFVTLTYAQSLDGQISLSSGLPTVLSGPSSKAMTHYLRSTHQAILVGSGTVLADDPGLNCRLDEVVSPASLNSVDENRHEYATLKNQPQPIILDRRGRWNPSVDSKIIKLAANGKGRPPWIIISNFAYNKLPEATRNVVTTVGGQFLTLADENSNSFSEVLTLLSDMKINSIMIEGGGIFINEILSKYQHIIDSIIITIAPLFLGKGGVLINPDREENSSPVLNLLDVSYLTLDRDIVLCGRVNQGTVDNPLLEREPDA